ncbi:hypothetical protein [Streptomyces sp. WM6386]|uniref:hypothetical protein n=1 Tax=Streptomyces sp. WM6386 TaxID=1415558 RepID=UPI000B2645CF|nr:hypothetical protein [Streptomyces sp. WM6386]
MTTMTDTAPRLDAAFAQAPQIAPPSLFAAPRGRHRRPRPRKILLAAGGLALAAGALGLVRLASEPGLGGGLGTGTTEAEPRFEDPGTGTDRATNAAATVGPVPKVSPSATATMGGPGATPTAAGTVVPLPSATTAAPAGSAVPAAVATTIPDAPNTPAPATTPPAAAPSSSAPQPAPAPTPSQSTPSPEPQQPGGVCVPVIGLCVGPLGR